MSTPQVTVDIVSDFVCPWCWLGKKYFEQAEAETDSANLVVRWHPYMLDPAVPEQGLPYKAYMKAKFGDAPGNRFAAMRKTLEEAAPDAGIEFHFEKQAVRPNTMKAHLLMRWAQGQGKGNAASEALFSAYFKDLRDIGQTDIIKDIASEIGLDRALITSLIESGRDIDAIKQDLSQINRMGISGVPTFIYQNQYPVQGAQPAQTHRRIIAEIAAQVT